MTRDDRTDNELSRPIVAADIVATGRDVRIVASGDERRRVAGRLGLPSVGSLVADLVVSRRPDGLVAVRGSATADVEQRCVVTLEPFARAYRFDIEALYDPAPPLESETAEIAFDPMADDPPEPAPDGRIDLGELVVQELAVSLDPFPRAPGAVFDPSGEPALADGGPFAALRRLREGRS